MILILKSALKTLILLVFLLLPAAVFSANESQSMSFEDWVERLKKQALSAGISPETITISFLDIKPLTQSASFTPKPSTYFLDQYLGIALSEQQLAYQKGLLQRYGNVLFEISHLFGVEPEVLIAVWSLDNLEAKNKQTYNAIELLVSTTFNQPKNKQAQEELFQALKLIDQKQVNLNEMLCDENGLLGTTYFKPSILRNYGIDYDGDGLINVWSNYADIFASIANYLSTIGWKSKQPWGMEVRLPETLDPGTLDSNIQYTVNYWHAQGVRRIDDSDLPLDGSLGSIIKPEPFSERTILALDNYFALLRWKRSHAFALAVGLITDKLQPSQTNEPATPFLMQQ